MPSDDYLIDHSGAASASLARVVTQAAAEGRGREVAPAVRWIQEELARTPSEFGESRNWYDVIGVQARVATVGPVTVAYGVDEVHRVVFVSWYKLGK